MHGLGRGYGLGRVYDLGRGNGLDGGYVLSRGNGLGRWYRLGEEYILGRGCAPGTTTCWMLPLIVICSNQSSKVAGLLQS